MTDPNSATYPPIGQLVANYMRQGLHQTAQLAMELDSQLEQRFGALTEWRHSPRAVPAWLGNFVEKLLQHRAHAQRLDQYGETDHGRTLALSIAISVLSQAVTNGDPVTPAAAEQVVELARAAVKGVIERVNSSRDAEAGKARFLQQWNAAQTFRAFHAEEKRRQQIAELQSTRARLEAALGE